MNIGDSTKPIFNFSLFRRTFLPMETTRQAIAKRIREIREASGMSQGALAEKCGWSGASTVSNYETGQRDVSVEALLAIAKALDTPAEYLVFGRYFETPSAELDLVLETVIEVVEEILQTTGKTLSAENFAKLVANLVHDSQNGVDITRDRVRNWIRLFP